MQQCVQSRKSGVCCIITNSSGHGPVQQQRYRGQFLNSGFSSNFYKVQEHVIYSSLPVWHMVVMSQEFNSQWGHKIMLPLLSGLLGKAIRKQHVGLFYWLMPERGVQSCAFSNVPAVMRTVSDLSAIFICLLKMVCSRKVTRTVLVSPHKSIKPANDMLFYLFNSDLGFFYIWP